MNYQARFSGRQKLAVSPAKAGLQSISGALPRAALRSTSFRYAGPGLNSAAGSTGSLNGLVQKCLWVVAALLLTFALSGCRDIHEAVHPGTDSAHPSSSPAPAGVSSSADVVKVSSPEIKISPNSSAEAIVTLSISPGYHINANPATFSYLIATALSPGQAEGITAGKPVYPVAQKKKFQFADEPLAVYEGEVQIKLTVRVESNADKGARSLPIDVRVQACDSEKCYAPDTLKTTIAVNVK